MPLATFLWLILCQLAVGSNSEVLIITKCCKYNEVFDISSSKCKVLTLEDEEAYIQPNYVYVNASVEITDMKIIGHGMEKCDEDSKRHVMTIPDNDISIGSIFATFLNGDHFSLVDTLTGKIFSDFCLDKGYIDSPYAKTDSFFGTVAVVCEAQDDIYCQHHPCIRHCCSWHQYFSSATGTCENIIDAENDESVFNVTFWNDAGEHAKRPEDLKELFDGLDHGMKCNKTYPYSGRKHELKFFQDASVVIGGLRFQPFEYCINHIEDSGGKNNRSTFWTEIYVCAEESKACEGPVGQWHCMVDLQVIPGLFCLSMIFLGLLFLHVWYHKRQTLFGCMMMSTILMLFIFYLVLTAVKLAGGDHRKDFPGACEFEALVIQFSYMSAVFWLNAMSHMIWQSFRRIRAPQPGSVPKASSGIGDPKYKWYALYSWGCPLCVTIVTLTLQHLPSESTKHLYTPGIGNLHCFLESGLPTLFYFHLINAPVLVANFFFFGLFLWNMLCGIWSNSSGDPRIRQNDKTRMKAVIKMYFVMGVTWIAEIVSWILHETSSTNSKLENVYKVTFIFDFINALQGLFMFCVIYFDTVKIQSLWSKLQIIIGKQSATVAPMTDQCGETTLNSSVRSCSSSWRKFTRAFSRSPNVETIELDNAKVELKTQ